MAALELDEYDLSTCKYSCHQSHLFFTRMFFHARQGTKFLINWHHHYMADELEKVFTGETENLLLNVPPGSSKTETAVVNFIARALARNPRCRFLHLSGSDDLAMLNSQLARDIVTSDEFQALWPMLLAPDSKAKKRWNILLDGKIAGGLYATSLGGQITGFRAGHMAEGFQGAIIIDDPVKPEDTYSKPKMKAASRKLLTTIKSRRAKPKTPIIMIMQRISDTDPSQFVLDGGLQANFKHVIIPAMLTDDWVEQNIPPQYHHLIDRSVRDEKGRFSYWEFKEPIAELNAMEAGNSVDQDGNAISRHVFSSQYQQSPRALGGNIVKGEYFKRYVVLPKISYRKIYADTAQKTAERNDYSVFQCWGEGVDGKIYLLDQIRGKWQAPELKRRAIAFWAKHSAMTDDELEKLGNLREMKVEDKSSGTGLIQSIQADGQIPVVAIERSKDKLTRVMDGLPYYESGMVCIPEAAPWVNDYVDEHEAFTADDSHAHDDQVDPTLDAINDMLSINNPLRLWEKLGNEQRN